MKKKLFLKGWVCLVMALCFSACSLFIDDDDDEEVEAQVPQILSVSEDVATVINVAKSISVTAKTNDNGTLSYQWYESSSKISKGSAISQAVESSYTPPTNAVGTLYYYCEVTNTLGSSTKSVISPYITYKVSEHIEAQKPVIATQCENVAQDFGTTFKLSVSAVSKDGGVLSYQWYFSATQDSSFNALSTKTASTLEDTVSKDSLGYYYCVVTNTIEDNSDGGEKTATEKSNTVIVSNNVVNANTPTITAQPVSVIMVIPATNEFTVGAYSPDGELSYQWYEVAEGESSGTAISGATESKYKATKDTIGKFGYYCVIKNTIIDNGDGGMKTASITSETAYLETDYISNFIQAVFTTQPTALSIAPMNESITLSAEAEASGSEISYKWYESATGKTDDGVAISGANTNTLSVPATSEKGSRYYYCVATATLGTARAVTASLSAISSLATVVCTGLPTVYIDTPDSAAITSKEDWLKNATISIKGSSYDISSVKTSIRGRGNSTWVQPKKPYALKLDKKQSILGMPSHKRWVLIANYLDNSFMRNEMAFYLSSLMELDYTVRGHFCDLVLNGEYKGLYWLGEAIKPDENRVNINDGSKTMSDEEDKDYLIEMDVYYDEIVKFKSSIRSMPYMLKNDDYMIDDAGTLTTGGQARLSRLQEKITALEEKLYPDFTEGMNTNSCSAPDETYKDVIDIESWAKFYLVNELMSNGELGHPKSCYFTFDSANNIFKAGPVWDFDWASLSQSSSCTLQNTIYYNALFKSPSFKEKVREVFSQYSSSINIANRIEEMREEIALSAEYDTKIWGEHNDPSGIKRTDFNAYVDFLKDTLQKKLVIVTSFVNSL